MASKYIPFASYSNSSNQYYLTIPSSALLPVYDPYWAIVKDSSDNYYLMPFNGSGFTCANITTKLLDLMESSGFYDESIDFSNGDSFYYELSNIDTNLTTRFYTDFRKPVVSTANQMKTLCSSTMTYSGNNTNTSRYIINKFEISSGSNESSSCDISPLIPAILMIPATLIVIACFSIIYRMFINRRVRG